MFSTLIPYVFSPERLKYKRRVESYRKDKKQLDEELKRAVKRIKEGEDRSELLSFDNEISVDQVSFSFFYYF